MRVRPHGRRRGLQMALQRRDDPTRMEAEGALPCRFTDSVEMPANDTLAVFVCPQAIHVS